MLTVKTNTKAFEAFKNEAVTEVSRCSIRATGKYFTLSGGSNKAKDGRYYYDILPSDLFSFYAPDECSKISLDHTSSVKIYKQYGSKFTMQFILRTNELSAGLHGPEAFYHVNAVYCTKAQTLKNITVTKYNYKTSTWENFATRTGAIQAQDLALFILHNNYASAKASLQSSVNDYASYVTRTGDYS